MPASEPPPQALTDLRRSLARLADKAPAVDGELDALAHRLAELREQPPVDRDAIWTRIEAQLTERVEDA